MKKVLSLIVPLLVLAGCKEDHIKDDKHNYHETKDSLIGWNETFNQIEDEYIVYFYSETCGHCNSIKQDVISFYLKEYIPMYFVCTDLGVVYGKNKDIVGVDNIDEFFIYGTPSLCEINSHKVESYYVGEKEILDYINQFK